MIPQVYLAGQITGLSYDEARAWRIEATKLLEPYGVGVLDPTRGKDALADEDNITPDAGEKLGKSGADIFNEDIAFINASQCILLKFCLGFGTPFEFGYAWALGIPVVVWFPSELLTYAHHPFTTAASGVAASLEQAVELTIHQLKVQRQETPFTYL